MRKATCEYALQKQNNRSQANGVKQHGCLFVPGHNTGCPAGFHLVRNRGERLMYIIVDDRESVANSYIGGLVREGVSSFGFS